MCRVFALHVDQFILCERVRERECVCGCVNSANDILFLEQDLEGEIHPKVGRNNVKDCHTGDRRCRDKYYGHLADCLNNEQ